MDKPLTDLEVVEKLRKELHSAKLKYWKAKRKANKKEMDFQRTEFFRLQTQIEIYTPKGV